MNKTDNNIRRSIIFGFVSLFLCGIGDWLIGYEPAGGEPILFGISSTSITDVPTWFFALSLMFGILSGFGCYYFSPAMIRILESRGIPSDSKMFKTFRFGLTSAPMMFVSFHAACCISLMIVQASLRAGMDAASAEGVFLFPLLASLVPFLIWCYICDIPVTVAYMYMVLKGKLGINRAAFVLCPLGLSIVGKIVGAVLVAIGSKYAFMTACGESWGYAFMCLAFLAAQKKTVRS